MWMVKTSLGRAPSPLPPGMAIEKQKSLSCWGGFGDVVFSFTFCQLKGVAFGSGSPLKCLSTRLPNSVAQTLKRLPKAYLTLLFTHQTTCLQLAQSHPAIQPLRSLPGPGTPLLLRRFEDRGDAMDVAHFARFGARREGESVARRGAWRLFFWCWLFVIEHGWFRFFFFLIMFLVFFSWFYCLFEKSCF